MRSIEGWGLFAFATGTCFLFGYGQQRMLGVLMIASLLVINVSRPKTTFKRLFPVPPEIRLYTAWVAWSLLTGPLVSVDLDLLWAGLRVLLQIFIVVWVAYAILTQLQNDDVVFLAILTGGLVQIWFVVSGAGSFAAVMDKSERLMGTTNNPNNLGFLMVWGVFCAMLYWFGNPKLQRIRRGAILAYIPLAVYVLLATGSRKSTLGMGLLIYLWAVFGPRPAKGLRKVFLSVVVGGLLFAGFVQLLPDFVERTPAGRRFQAFMVSGGGDITIALQKQSRFEMYVDGLATFAKHPLFGVGLNNFQKYFYTGHYSHSNYIEPLTTTGLIGFMLYQAFYILPLLRIRRLMKVIKDRMLRYRLKVYFIGIIAILVIGFGAPHYTNAPIYLLLTAISVTTWRLQRQHLPRRKAAKRPMGKGPLGPIGRPPGSADHPVYAPVANGFSSVFPRNPSNQ